MARAFSLTLRIGTFLACVLYMAYSVDMRRALETLLLVRPLWVGLATCGIVLSIIFNGARVRVLAARRITLLGGVNATVLALAANIALPGRLGELAKLSALKLKGLSLGEALRIIFIERLADLNLSGTFALVLLGFYLPGQRALLMAALAAAWLLLLAALACPGRLRRLLAPVLAGLSSWPRLKAWLDTALDALFERTPKNQLAGLAAHSLLSLAAYFLANGLVIRYGCGIDLPWLAIVSAICVGMLSLAVPATPAGLGVYEAGLVWVFGLFGVDAERALVAAVVSHAIQIFPILPWAGMISLLTRGRQMPPENTPEG